MKFIKKILWMVIFFFVAFTVCRYVAKEKIFPYKYSEYVNTYSDSYDLKPLFVFAVIKTESNFNEGAHSHKDAVGLMQITGDTGEWIASEMGMMNFSKDDLYNEEINIKMGCWYLRYLLDMFNGNMDLAVAAYNAGPTNVNRWLQDENYSLNGEVLHYIPFGETKKYVDKVNVYYKAYKFLYEEDIYPDEIKNTISYLKEILAT